MNTLYDSIALNHADLRKPDPQIAQTIESALGDAETVLNVGAGAGSYEPANRQITAIDPSTKMIKQRPASNAIVVQGCAKSIPYNENTFDASMAVLTIHRWSDQERGVAQMRRVTRDKVVFLSYDSAFRGFWLADYFPTLVTLDESQMPQIACYEKWLGPVEVSLVPIPHDCSDGFLAGYWRRPHCLSRRKSQSRYVIVLEVRRYFSGVRKAGSRFE